MAGTFTSSHQVCLSHLLLPEFGHNISLATSHARVFSAECRYDMILGRDTLRHFRLTLDFDKDIIHGPTAHQPMRCFPTPYPSHLCSLATQLQLDHLESHFADANDSFNDDAFVPLPASDNELSVDNMESFVSDPQILPSQYT